jgi:tRNA (adenine57-N1/adenine58-N1)-methyltransferase
MSSAHGDERFVAPGTAAPLSAGETVVLRDRRGRRSLVTLRVGGVWHSHSGAVDHDRLIGSAEGTAVTTPKNEEILALRPTREDFILKMRRGAQIVYPKDQAMIVALADIRPGMHVFEAGVGSGGLTLALLDAVGPTGSVISCEIREDHAEIARRNVARFHGGPPTNWQLHVGDAQDVLATTQVQRIVLDLLEPWRLLRASARSLPPGGLLLTYVPSVPQIMRITETLWELGTFTDVSTVETLVRGWDLEGLAVRPAHRMVAHTAFLTRARRVPTRAEGGPQPPRARRVQTAGLRWVDDLDGAIPEEDQGAAHPDEERLDEAQPSS